MKTNKAKNWAVVCAAVLTAIGVFRAPADQPAPAALPGKHFTGTVTFVNPDEHVLRVRSWLIWNRRFSFGDQCAYSLLDANPGTAQDLRPGEKVTVSYQDAHGVLVADRVTQLPMRYEGMVKAIALDTRTLTLRTGGMDKAFQISSACGVGLRNGKSGTLADIQTGSHVTVTYEKPDGKLVARQIAQTSLQFSGALTAIDLGEKTLKAQGTFSSKEFNVADDCAIVINGKPDGRLSDLKPDERLVFSYDEINGVNVLNRIAPVADSPGSVAGNTPPMAGN